MQNPTVILLAIAVLHIQAVSAYLSGSTTGTCSFRGYGPAGTDVIDITEIDSPTVKLHQEVMHSLTSYFKRTGEVSNLVMHGHKALEITTWIAQAAPKLGPVLGVTGVAFGFLASLTQPTPSDILRAAQAAIDALAQEVDRKMENMQEYVDNSVLKLEKKLVTEDFVILTNVLASCIDRLFYNTKSEINNCMVNAYKETKESEDKFLISRSLLNNWADENNEEEPSKEELRGLEIRFILFREYATHSVKLLKTISETFCEEPKDPEEPSKKESRVQKCTDFSQEMLNKVDLYEQYAKDSAKVIKAMHAKGSCSESYQCAPFELETGFGDRFWVTSQSPSEAKLKCWCKMDKYMFDDRCQSDYTAKFYRHQDQSEQYDETRMQREVKKKFDERQSRFLTNSGEFIDKFWQTEILDIVPSWERLATGNEGDTENEGNGRAGIPRDTIQATLDKFKPSPNFLKMKEKIIKMIRDRNQAKLKRKNKQEKKAKEVKSKENKENKNKN